MRAGWVRLEVRDGEVMDACMLGSFLVLTAVLLPDSMARLGFFLTL